MNQAVTKTILRAGRSQLKQVRSSSSYGAESKLSTMNDLPVPSGSWAAMHSARQTKNNAVLLAGLALFGASLAYGYQSGAFYLNLGPELKNKK